jgi:hypothetical protein
MCICNWKEKVINTKKIKKVSSTSNFHKGLNQHKMTKRRGRMTNTPIMYSVGPGFDSRPRRPAILIEVFRNFP